MSMSAGQPVPSGSGLSQTNAGSPVLQVRDLRVHFSTPVGVAEAVAGVSFTLGAGRTLGLVGESGSGKSVTALSVLGLTKRAAALLTGEIWLDGHEIVSPPEAAIRPLRGRVAAMVFQDPLSALHPLLAVGRQVAEAYRVHHRVSRREAARRAVEMLDRVGVAEPDRRAHDRPHELSGGQRQRVLLAMALVNNPRLLIADEPTSSLDVTAQAEILDLLRGLQREFGTSILLVTHDMGVLAELADDVAVMYRGRIVECGEVDEVFHAAGMPYTWGLLTSVPRLGTGSWARPEPIPGSPPSPIGAQVGCAFQPRCRYRDLVAADRCSQQVPDLEPVDGNHLARCHLTAEQQRRIFYDQVRPAIGLGRDGTLA